MTIERSEPIQGPRGGDRILPGTGAAIPTVRPAGAPAAPLAISGPPVHAPRDERPLPRELGPYTLEHPIGEGGQAIVYRAIQTSLHRPVALKILAHGQALDPQFVERFHREAKLAARLAHPNVVRVYDSGNNQGWNWLAMELVEGPTVSDVLSRQGPFPETRALEIARSVALAMGCASEHGILHRDIKPQNVLLTTDGTTKLADLGMARDARQVSQTQTATGVVLGTPLYMSPEQVVGRDDLDVRSDIYALGIMTFQMLTGRVPLEGQSAVATMMRHAQENVPPPSAALPGVTRHADLIVAVMTARNRDFRYPDSAKLGDDIDAVLKGKAPPFASAAIRRWRKQSAAAPGAAPIDPAHPGSSEERLAASESGWGVGPVPKDPSPRRVRTGRRGPRRTEPETAAPPATAATRMLTFVLLGLAFLIVGVGGILAGVLLSRPAPSGSEDPTASVDDGPGGGATETPDRPGGGGTEAPVEPARRSVADRLRERASAETTVIDRPDPDPIEDEPGDDPPSDEPVPHEELDRTRDRIYGAVIVQNFTGALEFYRSHRFGSDLDRLAASIDGASPRTKSTIAVWARVDRACVGDLESAERLGVLGAEAERELLEVISPQERYMNERVGGMLELGTQFAYGITVGATRGNPADALAHFGESGRPSNLPGGIGPRELRQIVAAIKELLGEADVEALESVARLRAILPGAVRGESVDASRPMSLTGDGAVETIARRVDSAARSARKRAAKASRELRPRLERAIRGVEDEVARLRDTGVLLLPMDGAGAWALRAEPFSDWRCSPVERNARVWFSEPTASDAERFGVGEVALVLSDIDRFEGLEVVFKGWPDLHVALEVQAGSPTPMREPDLVLARAVLRSDVDAASEPLDEGYLDGAWSKVVSAPGSGYDGPRKRFRLTLEDDGATLVIAMGDDRETRVDLGEGAEARHLRIYLLEGTLIDEVRLVTGGEGRGSIDPTREGATDEGDDDDSPAPEVDPPTPPAPFAPTPYADDPDEDGISSEVAADRRATRPRLQLDLTGPEASGEIAIDFTNGTHVAGKAVLMRNGRSAIALTFDLDDPPPGEAILHLRHLGATRDKAPGRVEITISVNGVPIAPGFEPQATGPWVWDRFDLARHLIPGTNTVDITLDGGHTAYWLERALIRW